MTKTKIDWTDVVWNPVTGCTPAGVGCTNCYARGMAKRFWGPRRFGDIETHEDRLARPFGWKKPRMVFVCSMGDLFHSDVPVDFIGDVLRVCALSRRHTFQILTKRPERMRDVLNAWKMAGNTILPNLWLGVSVSDQSNYENAIGHLQDTPAAVRFLSAEPLIGPVDFYWTDPARPAPRVDWVIVGAESGPKRRTCKTDWVRGIRDQCVEAGVSLFVKQADIGGKLVKMPEIDGKVWREYPRTGKPLMEIPGGKK